MISSTAEISEINSNYKELAMLIIEEHNKIRQDPSSYIEKAEEFMKYIKGDILSVPGEEPLQTYEGKAAYIEAIEFLKNQEPVHSLQYTEELNNACSDHVTDIGEKGLTTHDGS